MKLMQSSENEKRYFVRIMIVGKETVGKTCLLRRLLNESIEDVSSTDGIDIVVRRCKINIEDGKWTTGKGIWIRNIFHITSWYFVQDYIYEIKMKRHSDISQTVEIYYKQ